jgi:hypothetical protein
MAHKKQKFFHSCPSWILGLRPADFKFSTGIISGIKMVEDRLLAIKASFPDDLTSFHVFLECLFGNSEANSPDAIAWDALVKGVKEGIFPSLSAFTAPAFGFKGIESSGGILSDDSATVEVARQAHLEAMRRSAFFANLGLGKRISIFWPGWISRTKLGYLSTLNPDVARERMTRFWIDTLNIALEDPTIAEGLEEDQPVMYDEFKPDEPGLADYFPTMQAAAKFATDVNNGVGRKVMSINLEFAHALIGGETVTSAVKKQIAAGLFDGFVHVNSAALAIVKWNKAGTKILKGATARDYDWMVGEDADGCDENSETWLDQQEAVRLMVETGQDIVFEHDINHAGRVENPIDFYAESRSNLEKMLLKIGTI